MQAEPNGVGAAATAAAANGLDTIGVAMGQAVERGQAMMANSLKAWESEVARYFEQFADHSQTTMAALARCRGPMDVLAVEQEWLKRRTQAYMDSSLRFAQAFADVARTVAPGVDAGAPPAAGQPPV